jgi:hypothetical protein
MISLILLLVGRLTRQVFTHMQYAKISKNVEQAKLLAFGGITMTLCKLEESIETAGDEKETNDKNKPSSSPSQKPEKPKTSKDYNEEKELNDKELQSLYATLLPHLNKWQTFSLDKQIDGIDAKIKVCISSEDGKLNLNEVFNFETKEFKEEFANLLPLKFQQLEEDEHIDKALIKFFEKRNKKLDDISELLEIGKFELFYHPPEPANRNADPEDRPIGLYDFFTLWGSQEGLNPILFSDTVAQVLKFRRGEADDAKKRKKVFKSVSEQISRDMIGNSQQEEIQETEESQKIKDKSQKDLTNPDIKKISPRYIVGKKSGWTDDALSKIAPLYQENSSDKNPSDKNPSDGGTASPKKTSSKNTGPENSASQSSNKEDDVFEKLKKIRTVFSAQIEPQVFSILSYAYVSNTVQGLFAVVRRKKIIEKPESEKASQNKKTEKEINFLVPPSFEVIRFFWI